MVKSGSEFYKVNERMSFSALCFNCDKKETFGKTFLYNDEVKFKLTNLKTKNTSFKNILVEINLKI